MHSEQLAPHQQEEKQGPALRCRHRLTANDPVDVPIADMMSIPLDRLCQLAWPLLPQDGAHCSMVKSLRVPCVSQTGIEEARLSHAIDTTVVETLRAVRPDGWWGQLSCHTLRAALFREALQTMREKAAVVPPGQLLDASVSCRQPSSELSATTGATPLEGETLAGTEETGNKTQCRLSELLLTTEEACVEDEMGVTEKRRFASLSWVLSYLVGVQDDEWMIKKVQEMVETASLPSNDIQKQLISTAASVSVHAHLHKRSARVFLCILRVVLSRWNAAPNTTGENGVFGFSVVLPLLHITRFTKFDSHDVNEVAQLLAMVQSPPQTDVLDNEPLSTATFVTKYTLFLEGERGDSSRTVSTPYPSIPATQEQEQEVEQAPSSERSLLLGMSLLLERAREVELRPTISIPAKATEVFLVAPRARRVGLYVRRAKNCEGVQIVLIPDSHISDDTASDGKASASRLVWFEPRVGVIHEISGGCSGVLRYCAGGRSTGTILLETELRVERSLQVDSRWVEEFRNALSTAQLEAAAFLLKKVQKGCLSSDSCLKEESFLLFSNGFTPQSKPEVLPPFVEEISSMADEVLCKRVPCRQNDARGVRSALSLIAYFLEKCGAEDLTWESRAWQEVVKRVSFASHALGGNSGATEMSTFVIENTVPGQLSRAQILEGVIALLGSNITANRLRTVLMGQSERATNCVLALSLLLRAKESFVPSDMYRMVSLLRDVMMYDDEHYLMRFRGCGEPLEEQIRVLVHRLLGVVFTALQRVMSLPEGERRRHGPHRFLCDSDEFGPFAVVSLSLLATTLDARDLDFVWHKIVNQVEGLLPNFTDFARSASFKVNDVEEGGVVESLRALVDGCSAYKYKMGCADEGVGGACECDDVQEPLIDLMMLNATERAHGIWVPTGQGSVCCTATPLYSASNQPRPSVPGRETMRTPMSFSRRTTMAAAQLPSQQLAISTSLPDLATSIFCAADIHLSAPPAPELFIALASEQHATLPSKNNASYPKEFYFSPQSGILQHGEHEIALPPLAQGDTFTFSFSFSTKSMTRTLSLVVNGVQLVVFPAPQCPLFLHVGMSGPSLVLRASDVCILFRSCKAPSPFISSTQENSASVGESGMMENNDGLPTRYSISMFATLVFSYLISLCARRLAHTRRSLNSAENAVSASQAYTPSPTGVARRGLHSEEAWKRFIVGYCNRLRLNMESLVDSLRRLPRLHDVRDATERVKLNVASFVYHRFLMDYITIVNTAIRWSSSLVDMFSTLARVVCCEEVCERERCAALITISTVLRESYVDSVLASFDPMPLWESCSTLSRFVIAQSYRPVFSTESVEDELGVFSGGRQVRPLVSSCFGSRGILNTTSLASRGILLDGSMGNTVSFSVTVKRMADVDSLGHYYYIGVACPRPHSTDTGLSQHPGTRQAMAHVYALTDCYSDVVSLFSRAELLRHSKHWMSSEDNIIFGSGDVITVTVNTRARCVSFERNGMPLGILYTKIPSSVKVLFPFVELFNRDASATWMYMPREIGIRARSVMRVALSHWPRVLVPRLAQMLEENDEVALQVLGADGDEMSFTCSTLSRDGRKTPHLVRLIRQLGSMAKVMVEGGDVRSTIVSAWSLEPRYGTVVSNELPVVPLLDEIMCVLSRTISFSSDLRRNEVARIRPTKMFIYALRLLSEVDPEALQGRHVESRRMLLSQLIRLLATPGTIPSDSSCILQESWDEVMLLPDDDELCILIPPNASPTGQSTLLGEDGGSEVGKESVMGNGDAVGKDISLRCPSCDMEWGDCTNEHHTAPYCLCATLDCVLRRLGLASPFTGMFCEWSLPSGNVRIAIRLIADEDVEGEGEDSHGQFTFNGKRVSNCHLQGRCVYKCIERPDTPTPLEEWVCTLCTFINLSDSTRCAMCATARPGATWSCPLCGYSFNSNNSNICATCGHMHIRSDDANEGCGSCGKQAFCEGCQKTREYTAFYQFVSRSFCEECQCETLWLPDERHVGIVEATLVGTGDKIEWEIALGGDKCAYELRSTAYSFERMLEDVVSVSPTAGDLSRYVPPLGRVRVEHGKESTSCASSTDPSQPSLIKEEGSPQHRRAVIPAILFFCSRIVCRWGPDLIPRELSEFSLLERIRVMENSWLEGLKKVNSYDAHLIFFSCLRLLLVGKSNEQVIWSLSSIARAVMNSNPPLLKQRDNLLYALTLNAARESDNRRMRSVCYAELNALLEESCEHLLNVRCLQEVCVLTPVVMEQQRLMVLASLRGVDVSTNANVTLTSWLIQAVERMERGHRLSALFDMPSPDIFPCIVELPDTRMGSGGELVVGQVRGSVGVLGSKGGRYYYEIVLPPNFGERNRTVIMGWGTMQHEVLSSGQHVGSDIYSWGFNCQDRLRILTGEQQLVVPRQITGGDVVGALLDLDSMMMCWSVNGEELLWVPVSIQSKGEAIYPFVSASMEPYGICVRLGNTQFKPKGYEDFSPTPHEEAQQESLVAPRSYDFYLELCAMAGEIVNGGFTLDSLVETLVWEPEARLIIKHYPRLYEEVGDGSLTRLRPYFQHLRSINMLAVSVAKSHDIFRRSAYFMKSYQKTRRLLFFEARWAVVERQIDRRLIRNSHRRQREVLVDLSVAKSVWQSCEDDHEKFDVGLLFGKCVSGQLFNQTYCADIYRDAVMFVTRLVGEVVDDAGGVTRSVFSMMCDELNYRYGKDGQRMEPLLPFFRLAGHSTVVTIVPNVDFFNCNPQHQALFLQFFTWLGKMIGNATLSGNIVFAVALPRLVWKFLTFEEPTVEDYYADIDDAVRGALSDDEFLLNDEFYYAIPAVEREVESTPETMAMVRSNRLFAIPTPVKSLTEMCNTSIVNGGDSAEVERRRAEAERALVHQYDKLLIAMRSGLTSVVPVSSLQLVRWDDLQQRVCGSPSTAAEDVLASMNTSLLPAEIHKMLVDIIHEMNQRQRSQLLLFCSGQRRLPLPEKVQVSCGDNPEAIPTAHTCSPISLQLQPYPSVAVMREKLEICLRHVYEFGFV
ncbi:SPRY domain [Trypanosoma vivax]|nr:SPRY domain [Trypanosoma vivax]